jgi:molybdenum cofactor cytidylyltransferase
MNEASFISKPVIILLAAGQSRRLGRPKQLLEWNGASLLSRSLRAAQNLQGMPVVVVLGAHADQIRPQLMAESVTIVDNPEWQEGMAASIRVGLGETLNRFAEVDGVIIMVCDQPGLDHHVLQRLVALQRSSGRPVAAAAYAGRLGTPAIFHRSVFPALQQLKGDKGARQLLNEMGEMVAVLPFDAGVMDIDTEEDYLRLISGPSGL